MKFLSAAIVAVLTAGVSMTAAAAPAGYVPYKCDNGKKLNVVYEFDRSGNAVGASANAAGKQISLRVDKRQSDSTGTTFTNKRGFSMSAGYIDKNTPRHGRLSAFSPSMTAVSSIRLLVVSASPPHNSFS